jgi:hypothetical protein
MNTSLTTSTNSQPSTQNSQLIPSSPPAIENPSAWMRDGVSPTEIILATAILTSVCLGGIAGVIIAINGVVRTLVSERGGKSN